MADKVKVTTLPQMIRAAEYAKAYHDNFIVQMVGATPNCYRRAQLMSSDKTTITIYKNTQVNINDKGYVSTADVTLNLGDVASAANRAGTDMYVYACEPSDSSTEPVFVVSANSTVPDGYTADNSRKIGGFHCLCADVGTISGHTLSGYVAGDILPLSVWDLQHRAISENEGMVWIEGIGSWVDIYMASHDGTGLVSTYGGNVVSGTTGAVYMHGEKFAEDFPLVGKHLVKRDEFISIAKGSNENTSINSDSNPGTTGGHVDTAGRRLISNYGLEDCCGAWYQWVSDIFAYASNVDIEDSDVATLNIALRKGNLLRDRWGSSEIRWDQYEALPEYGGTGTSGDGHSSNQAGYSRIHHQTVDGDNRYGDMYGALYRVLVGGNWGLADMCCGSRCVNLIILSSNASSSSAGRGASGPRTGYTN